MGEEPRGRGWSAMAEHAYESLVRRTYPDFETGDLDLLGVAIAPEVVWHEPGRSSLAGHNNGPKEVLGFLRELKSRSSGTFKIEVLEVISEPERAVVFQQETAMKNGKTLDVIAAVDLESHNGRITEVTAHQMTPTRSMSSGRKTPAKKTTSTTLNRSWSAQHGKRVSDPCLSGSGFEKGVRDQMRSTSPGHPPQWRLLQHPPRIVAMAGVKSVWARLP
jgi:ketosteroid isomerase-like protein